MEQEADTPVDESLIRRARSLSQLARDKARRKTLPDAYFLAALGMPFLLSYWLLGFILSLLPLLNRLPIPPTLSLRLRCSFFQRLVVFILVATHYR